MDEDDSLSDQPLSNPSCSNETDDDDSRIRCTDKGSLCDIIKVTLSQIPELADSLMDEDDREDFITQFNKTFKNALLENIAVNELPLVLDNSKPTSFQNEGEKMIIDNTALYAKLSLAISKAAVKRKYYPGQICRIMNQKMKHEFQNVKKGKVIDSSGPKDFSLGFRQRNHTKHFNRFCDDLEYIQEHVQHRTEERKELETKISLASSIQKSQKQRSVRNKDVKAQPKF